MKERYYIREKHSPTGYPIFYVKDSMAGAAKKRPHLQGVEQAITDRAEAEYLCWALNSIEERTAS